MRCINLSGILRYKQIAKSRSGKDMINKKKRTSRMVDLTIQADRKEKIIENEKVF